jgi:hypothetical protein
MPVKKFICKRCGAPKINAYHSPYIVCDFCSSLVDVDYTSGYKVWTNNKQTAAEYEKVKHKIEAQLNQFLKDKNPEAYESTQSTYWDYYYKAFPQYLPPTVNTPEIYTKYIEAAARMSTDYAFNPEFKSRESAYQAAYSNLKYYSKDGRSYVTWESFEPMIKHYIQLIHDSFRACYDDPQFDIMHLVLPEDIHLKLKISQLAQIWIPYLEEEKAAQFLELVSLKYEYTDYASLKGETKTCSNCSHEQFVPDNALNFTCEQCNRLTPLKHSVSCSSCGNETALTPDWQETINCSSCGTSNRVIVPLFG